MRYKTVKCDICGKEALNDYVHLRVKEKIPLLTEHSRALDICGTCMREFRLYIKTKVETKEEKDYV